MNATQPDKESPELTITRELLQVVAGIRCGKNRELVPAALEYEREFHDRVEKLESASTPAQPKGSKKVAAMN